MEKGVKRPLNRTGTLGKDAMLTFTGAFAFIVYEVFLSRIFSAILDYNYVFLAISLATLGVGLGGYFAYKWSGFIYRFRSECLGLFALLLIVFVFAMYALPYLGIWYYALMALLPFLAGGSLLAAIVQRQRDWIRTIYFSDLAGAGIGAGCSVWLMNLFGPVQTISLLSAALWFVSSAFLAENVRKRWKVFYGVTLSLLLMNGIFPFSNMTPFRAYLTSPSNVFLNEDAKIVYSDWNSFSRTDVYDAGDGDLLYITIDGGAVSPISKYAGSLDQVGYLRTTTSYLAFQDARKERVLIIGAGGGQEVLTARMAGFGEIEAVDINAGSFRAVQELSRFSGNLFHQPGVTPIVSDGRNYIRKTDKRYDLIYLSLVKKESENGLGLALTENYIFTKEAVGEYIKKLKPGGKLAFLLHDETELMKVLLAAEQSLIEEGIEVDQTRNHMAVIGTYQHLGHVVWGMGGSKITRPLLILSNEPFSATSARRLKEGAESISQIPIHIPYVHEQFSLLHTIFAEQTANLGANRDDKPFFYNKTGNAPTELVWIAGLVLLIIWVLVRRTNYPNGTAVYFSGVAVGFMIIETTLVQRLILPLGHPTLSFVLVLGVLLFAGGIGSLLSAKWFSGHAKRYAPLMGVAFLALAVNACITWYNEQSFYWPMIYRLLAALFLLIPLGISMGMPFPYGLLCIPKRYVALSWAINGLMTVAGSILSVIISLTMGFTAAMTVGAAVYGLLYAMQPKLNMRTGNG